KERPALERLIAVVGGVFGVGLVGGDGFWGGRLFGDTVSFLTSFVVAAAFPFSAFPFLPLLPPLFFRSSFASFLSFSA
ncbi:hypothetical protein ACC776_37960, partial [Rhizobium johnstonii]